MNRAWVGIDLNLFRDKSNFLTKLGRDVGTFVHPSPEHVTEPLGTLHLQPLGHSRSHVDVSREDIPRGQRMSCLLRLKNNFVKQIKRQKLFSFLIF